MPVQRGYRQVCGVARALDVVGERWALLVVRELLLGPKRFTDLQAGMPGASPNALSDRLRELTDNGVIQRRRLAPPAATWVYELTDWGRGLEPIVLALGTWALGKPPLASQTFVSLDSVMLTIRTYYTPPPTTGPNVRLHIRLTDDGVERGTFGVLLTPTGATVDHQPPDNPDATLTTSTTALLAAFDQHRLPDEDTRLDGDRDAIRRLVAGVTVPTPTPVGATTPNEHSDQPTVAQ
jgi:DNA-binding HxlR family transcriptional regulator